MKKLTTVLLAAGLLVSASACTATKLTTAQTCERINLVAAASQSNPGKAGVVRIANAIRPVEPVASDELKPALKGFLDYMDESAKDTPDSAKLSELKGAYDQAGATFSKLCQGQQQ